MTSTKLNALAASVVSLEALPGTFGAIREYCSQYSGSPSGPPTIVGTLAAGLATGTGEFYSPVLPRGLRLNTGLEVFDADLDVQYVQITPVPNPGQPEVIVSGHAGTRELLAEQFPTTKIVEGNVSPDDIAGKVVVGTLPPHLVAETGAYVPVSIINFDYAKDGDINGDELRERLVIGEAVRVTVK